jgi:hypothetical protein
MIGCQAPLLSFVVYCRRKNSMQGFFTTVAVLLLAAGLVCAQSKKTPTTQAPQRATLAQQKMCDAQASKRFHDGRILDGHLKEDPSGMNGYTSHFDPSVSVCYVWVRWAQIDKNGASFADTISDAFEGRVYASYMWMNLQHKQAAEVAPTTCSVKPRGQDEITCTSEEEFDRLVDKYFGIGR